MFCIWGSRGRRHRSALRHRRGPCLLRETLAAGPRLASELRQDAVVEGISEKTLYAARRAEGITVAKERVPNGRWVWALTPPAEDHGEDGTPPSP